MDDLLKTALVLTVRSGQYPNGHALTDTQVFLRVIFCPYGCMELFFIGENTYPYLTLYQTLWYKAVNSALANMHLEQRLERLGDQNRLLSEKQAVHLFNQVCNLPPDKRGEAMRLFDTLQVPDYFPGEMAYALARPYQREMIRASHSIRIMTKAQLSDQALEDLESQARIALAKNRPSFPDIPQTPENLIYPDQFLRRFVATFFPHPVNGPPERWHQQTAPGWPRKLEERPSHDYQLMIDLFPLEKNFPLYESLQVEFKKVAESETSSFIPSDQLDRLKFLGFVDEETFVRVTESELIRRIGEKGGDVQKIVDFMKFSKESDNFRHPTKKQAAGKRITGESYYCHSLTSAWLLWTMIENDLNTPQDVNDAVEDVQAELVHDILEDLDSEIDPLTNILTVKGMSALRLTYEQRLILEAVKKKEYDDGAHWLQEIQDIRDPRLNSKIRDQKLKRRAARCKIADRFSNFLTITSTGEPYYSIMRKLDETYLAFNQLIGTAMLTGLPTFARLNKLESMGKQAEEGLDIWGMSDAIKLERTLLQIKFGLSFLKHIFSLKDKPWADALKQTITNEVADWNGDLSNIPDFWRKRLDHLCDCYMIPQTERQHIIPAMQLDKQYGIANFAGRLAETPAETPWEFNDFLRYFSEASNFRGQYRIGRGVALGGIEDLYIPEDIRFPFDFMHKGVKLLDRIL